MAEVVRLHGKLPVGGDTAQTPLSLDTETYTDELVFGIVGYVGSGISFTARLLQNILKTEYGYDAKILKASDLIKHSLTQDEKSALDQIPAHQRAQTLQTYGNKKRNQFGSSFLAAKFIEMRHLTRREFGGLINDQTTVSARVAHIFDSIKHPAEITLLDDIYGDMYYTIGLFAPFETLQKRLIRKFKINNTPAERSSITQLIYRDANEIDTSGQRVQDALLLADYFINNRHDSEEPLRTELLRFLDILFGSALITEKADESGMALAYSASLRSACLSRQVGAAILSETNELISIGWNDVPKFGGGLYTSGKSPDHRCFNYLNKECHKDLENKLLAEKIFKHLRDTSSINGSITEEYFVSEIFKTPLRDLVEFSRAIHAEMEAILAIARSGKTGIVRSTLYSTVHPCHNCARHIVAAGIQRVVYIEPYPKSAAYQHHDDSITQEPAQPEKVVMHIYEGVHPKNMLRFFGAEKQRKEHGRFIERPRRTATPIRKGLLRNFYEREGAVVGRLASVSPEGAA